MRSVVTDDSKEFVDELFGGPEVRGRLISLAGVLQYKSGEIECFGPAWPIDINQTHRSSLDFKDNYVGLLHMRLLAARKSPEQMVAEVAVVSAVASFEILLSTVAGTMMHLDNTLVEQDKKRLFTLADVIVESDRNELVSAAIRERVEDLARQGLKGWAQWYATATGDRVNMRRLSHDWTIIERCIETRNVIVHHGGAISAQYAVWARKNGEETIPIGQQLEINPELVRTFIAHLFVLGQSVLIRSIVLDDWHRAVFLLFAAQSLESLAIIGVDATEGGFEPSILSIECDRTTIDHCRTILNAVNVRRETITE